MDMESFRSLENDTGELASYGCAEARCPPSEALDGGICLYPLANSRYFFKGAGYVFLVSLLRWAVAKTL